MGEDTQSSMPFRILDSAEELLLCISNSQAKKDEWIALDAERASGFRYYQRAYLIQIHFQSNETWLIDPLIFEEVVVGAEAQRNLIEFLPERWILHASTQDFPCLFELGLRPREVFDTEVAAKLLGLPRVGLANLLSDLQGIELAKEHSASDWSMRPLTASMLSYAALDVQHLHLLMETLQQKLLEVERLDWSRQEFEHLLLFTPKPFDEMKWLKLPGIRQARDSEVSRIAKSLWVAREQVAADLDISPGRILPDRSIAAAAISKPQTKDQLSSNSEFTGRMSRSKLNLWWKAVQASANVDIEHQIVDGKIPNHRSWERRFPEAHARYGTLRPLIVEKADEFGLMPEILVSPDAIRAIAFEGTSTQVRILEILSEYKVRAWQRELILPTLLAWINDASIET